ncbi:RNA pyrophosphohydrolase [Paroceanicella profunda]|uniref:RNA pyrophosphohydrolase n=1 Tax=Paroceanicella profunda TaxID=2579971 RepID=A0A5B8G2D1_9RHOB|nr:RNA pyrophosphohydrolase [Paroceanicella profunda]QDL93479.1 RNA pyrophosphohydrolase [Paroceanicella profunda]
MPHLTAEQIAELPYRPCVGLMIVSRDGRIFAGQRIDNPTPAWQMPQGGVDDGEDPQEAALRELWEETGITSDKVEILAETRDWIPYDLPHHLVPKLWKGRYRGQKQRWFLLRFLGTDHDIDIATEHPEFNRWTWLEPGVLLEKIVPFKRDTYRRVIEEFRELVG